MWAQNDRGSKNQCVQSRVKVDQRRTFKKTALTSALDCIYGSLLVHSSSPAMLQGFEGGYAGDSSERGDRAADRAGQRVGLVVRAGYWADLGGKHCRDLHGSAGVWGSLSFSSDDRGKNNQGNFTVN